MLHETSVAPIRSSAVEPVAGWWPSRIRKPSTSRPFRSAGGWSAERRRRRDRAGAEPGDGGHDLEHRARARSGRAWRAGGAAASGRRRSASNVARRRRRVGDRRRVVGRRRGEGEDLAGARIEHDDRAPRRSPSAADGRPLEVVSDSDRVRSCGSYGSAPNLREQVGQRVGGQAGQLRVVGALEPRPAVAAARRSRRPG